VADDSGVRAGQKEGEGTRNKWGGKKGEQKGVSTSEFNYEERQRRRAKISVVKIVEKEVWTKKSLRVWKKARRGSDWSEITGSGLDEEQGRNSYQHHGVSEKKREKKATRGEERER